MPIRVPNLPYLKSKDPRLYETIVALHNGIESLVKQAGLGASGNITPPQIQSIFVSAANGIFSVSVTDKSDTHFGINYFIEYDTSPAFNNARTKFLGPTRDADGWNLGNQTYFFRAFSQYQSSLPSPRVVYGGATPIGVAGGGSAPPAPPPTQGSGTGEGGGFGGRSARIALE